MLFVKRQVFHLEGTTSYPKTMPQGTIAGSLHYPTHTGFSSGLQQIIGTESVDTKCVVRGYVNAAKMSDGVYSTDSRPAVFRVGQITLDKRRICLRCVWTFGRMA